MRRKRLTTIFFVVCVSLNQTTKAAPPDIALQQRMCHAVAQNEIESLRTLLMQGGDPNARVAPGKEDAWITQARPNDDPAPPLFVLACRFGNPTSEAINLLLAKGADVNLADANGVTPLMAAAELDWETSIVLLLEHGAKTKASDKSGKTALMYAMGNRGLGTAAKLLDKGAEINARDKAGRTALLYAITQAAHDPFLIFGEDVVKKDKEAQARYLELITFLIARKADVNAKDAAGNTPLLLATAQKQAEIVPMLRRAGAK